METEGGRNILLTKGAANENAGDGRRQIAMSDGNSD